MKLKLDENVPGSAKGRLVALGFDTDTVLDEGLGGRPDRDVWDAAQAAGRLLVTQDLDFSDARRFSPGTHHGVVIVRLGIEKRNSSVASRLIADAVEAGRIVPMDPDAAPKEMRDVPWWAADRGTSS